MVVNENISGNGKHWCEIDGSSCFQGALALRSVDVVYIFNLQFQYIGLPCWDEFVFEMFP